MRNRFLAVGLGLLALSSPAMSAPPADLAARVDALARLKSAYQPSAAPDGRSFAYLTNVSGSPQAWIFDRVTGATRQLTELPDAVSNVAWSPTGEWIAYEVAPGGGLNTQIYLVRPDGTATKRLTAGGDDNNGLDGWSDDGRFVFVNSNRVHPAARDAAMINVATGAWTMLTRDKGLNNISASNSRVAVVERLVDRGNSDTLLIDRLSKREVLLTAHQGKAITASLGLAPDGRTIVVISDVERDLGAVGVVTIAANGTASPIRYVVSRADGVGENGALSEDGRTLAVSWNVAGRSVVELYDGRTFERLRVPTLPFTTLSGMDMTRDGKQLLLVGSAPNATTDIYVYDIESDRLGRLTNSPHDGVDLATLVSPRLVPYAANDGTPLSGWLYEPRGGKGPYPTVYVYHGGPEGQSRPTLSADVQALAASGIAVFLPNVRGSSGFGKAFMAMDDKEKRVNSVADIQASTDALVKQGVADPARLGIMGGSYGGYMVMAGMTEYPDMFAAGANLYGVVNFDSFFKHTQPWMAAISTTEYGDPVKEKAMLASLSPLNKLDRLKGALFVLHGANDTNVPLIEAEQIVADLKKRGVPVRYTLFSDEGHGWRKIPNRIRSTTEIVDFFVTHLKP